MRRNLIRRTVQPNGWKVSFLNHSSPTIIVDRFGPAFYGSSMSDELPDRKHLTRIPVWIPDDQTVVYFVTTNCHNRRLIFRTPNTIKIALESLIKCAHSTEWNIPQICFMPDHVHLMMLPMREREQQLSSMMQRWKSSSKQRLNRAGESLTEKWRYVEMNPVRAGLCTLPEEFPYLGSPEQILARLNSL